MKLNFFLIAFIFFSCKEMNAQNQNSKPSTKFIYFKIFTNGKGPNLSKRQLDSFLLSRTSSNFKLIPQITGTEQSGDTLFYNIIFEDATSENLVGQPLPGFNFKDINGKDISTKDLKGKPLVINFWFAACVPCIAEMPALNALKEKYKDSGILFLSMTFETKSTVLSFLKQHHFTFTPISDAQEYCDKITQQYPITLFVDKQGIIKSTEHLMPPLFNYELTKRIDELDPAGFEKNIDAIKN